MSLKFIERIEFHEVKGNWRVKGIETRFYVSDVKEFLRWCIESQTGYYKERKFDEEIYNYYLRRVANWKKRKQKFDMLICGQKISIYPQDGYVAFRECGLHYICQHSFDILPSESCSIIYGYEVFDLGVLH